MNETNPQELSKAIEVFREREGDKVPLDMFKLDKIIQELRTEANQQKKTRRKK